MLTLRIVAEERLEAPQDNHLETATEIRVSGVSSVLHSNCNYNLRKRISTLDSIFEILILHLFIPIGLNSENPVGTS